MKWIRLLAVLPMLFLGSAAYAAETINYQYDALGRQISTTRSSGTQTAYTLDASGNRVQVQAGAAAAPTTPPSITVPTNSTGSYTISWGASTSGIVTAYELYESTSAGFTPQTLVYNGTGTSLAVASKPDGTYYYRVRACNVGLCSGYRTGSNPVTVQIPAGPTITLDNVSVTGEAPLGTLSFTYGLASTGFVTISGNGVTVSGPARLYWLTPQTGMNQYQGRATSACNHNTGTFNSWQALGTGSTPTWGVSLTPNEFDNCTITVEVRAIANPGVILDSGTITLELSTQP